MVERCRALAIQRGRSAVRISAQQKHFFNEKRRTSTRKYPLPRFCSEHGGERPHNDASSQIYLHQIGDEGIISPILSLKGVGDQLA